MAELELPTTRKGLEKLVMEQLAKIAQLEAALESAHQLLLQPRQAFLVVDKAEAEIAQRAQLAAAIQALAEAAKGWPHNKPPPIALVSQVTATVWLAKGHDGAMVEKVLAALKPGKTRRKNPETLAHRLESILAGRRVDSRRGTRVPRSR